MECKKDYNNAVKELNDYTADTKKDTYPGDLSTMATKYNRMRNAVKDKYAKYVYELTLAQQEESRRKGDTI